MRKRTTQLLTEVFACLMTGAIVAPVTNRGDDAVEMTQSRLPEAAVDDPEFATITFTAVEAGETSVSFAAAETIVETPDGEVTAGTDPADEQVDEPASEDDEDGSPVPGFTATAALVALLTGLAGRVARRTRRR